MWEHVKQKDVVTLSLKRILWNKDSDSGLTGFVFESICAKVVLYDFWCNRCLFIVFQCHSNVILCLFKAIFRLFDAILCLFVAKLDFGENLSKKIIESRYIGHFQIIGQIIDIDLVLPQIIGDFKELSAKLSISKFEGKLSKNYR